MSKTFKLGGIVASLVLIAFGVGSIVTGFAGRAEVSDSIKREAIVGSPDMTPSIIAKEAASLKGVDLPTCDVAGKPVETGADAKCFAEYMRIHTLLATDGKTYAEMPRFATADGKGTNDEAAALKNEKSGAPVDNPRRAIWINETALTTALNTSFFAQSVGLFAIVMGAALTLTGIGFLVLTLGLAGGAKAAVARKETEVPVDAAPAAA